MTPIVFRCPQCGREYEPFKTLDASAKHCGREKCIEATK